MVVVGGGGVCHPSTEKFISALFLFVCFWPSSPKTQQEPGRPVWSFWMESNPLISCADLPASLPKQTPPHPPHSPPMGGTPDQTTPGPTCVGSISLFCLRKKSSCRFHLHCMSKTTIGRHRDAPPIISSSLRGPEPDPEPRRLSSHLFPTLR